MAGTTFQLVLFAGDQQTVNGPRMLLRQIGIENLLWMMGGYVYVVGNLPEVTINKPYPPEEPALYFAGFMETLGFSPAHKEEDTPMQIQTVPRKKKSAFEVGC